MRPWGAAHVEVHASQTEPKLSGLHVLSRHVLPRCFLPRSRRRSPYARKPRTRRSLGSCDSPMRCACRRYRSATCTQLSLPRPDQKPSAPTGSRADPNPDLRMPGLNPVFCATFLPGLSAAPRSAPGAGEPALEPQEPLGFLQAQPSRTGHLTSGQRHRDSDTPVHADDAAGAWRGDRVRDHRQRDMPTARPPACDAVRLPTGQGAAAFERNPADLRDQHTGACTVVLTDPQPLRPNNPQALMLAGFTPRRAPMGSCEEHPPRTVKVPQRLLLDGLRPGSQPRLRSPGLGQLRGLGVETRSRALPTPPHQALLQAEVPHVPGVAALLQQEHFLCGARVQAEPHGTQRSVGHRHPDRNRTPILGVLAASSTTCTPTWCSPPINRAAMRGRFWSPPYLARSCGGAPPSTVKDYITNQKRPN